MDFHITPTKVYRKTPSRMAWAVSMGKYKWTSNNVLSSLCTCLILVPGPIGAPNRGRFCRSSGLGSRRCFFFRLFPYWTVCTVPLGKSYISAIRICSLPGYFGKDWHPLSWIAIQRSWVAVVSYSACHYGK